MSSPTVPVDNTVTVQLGDGSRYEHPVFHDVIVQPAYESRISGDLTFAPNHNYEQARALLPDGTKLSLLEEIAYLSRLERALKAAGRSPREALNKPIFDRFIRGNPYKWQHTDVALCAPNGARSFSEYSEVRDGTEYVRADYMRGNKIVARGIPVPAGWGLKILQSIPGLWVPAVVSDGTEPDHTAHWSLDKNKQEVSVQLGGDWYGDERGRCLVVIASYRRSDADENAAFRVVQGSLDDVPDPIIEPLYRDKESFERGVAMGRQQARKEFAGELQELLERYRQ